MKKLLEVGDRVVLLEGKYIWDFIGTTGVVASISEGTDDDGSREVAFILSEEDRVRMQRAPGFRVVTLDTYLKYLKPKKKKNKSGKVDEKFAKRLDKLGDLIMKGTATERELELVEGLALTLAALDVLEYIESTDEGIRRLKKEMLVELR